MKHVGWERMEVNPQILIKWIDEGCSNKKILSSQEDWWIEESINLLKQIYTNKKELNNSKSYNLLKQEVRHRNLNKLGI